MNELDCLVSQELQINTVDGSSTRRGAQHQWAWNTNLCTQDPELVK